MTAEGSGTPFPYRHTAFGVRWESEIVLRAYQQRTGDETPQGTHLLETQQPDILVSMADGPVPERLMMPGNTACRLASNGLRYAAARHAVIDTYDDARVTVYPDAHWPAGSDGKPDRSESLPAAFFGTVTALLLARRGCLALHGSAVNIDGRATLVCGAAGAGKSTSAARLIAKGATLISDDLSVLHPDPRGGPPLLFAGRRAIRLFPAAAEVLGRAVSWSKPPHPSEGKLAVYPQPMDPLEPVPLARVILLGGGPSGPVPDKDKVNLLKNQLFRPLAQDRLPGRRRRLAALAVSARSIEVVFGPTL